MAGSQDVAGRVVQFLGIVFAVPALAIPLVLWWRQGKVVTAAGQLDEARETLAGVVAQQWRQEALARSLGNPEPMPVCWGLTDPAVMDHPRLIAVGELSFTGCGDQISPLVAEFRRLRRRRLVILGGLDELPNARQPEVVAAFNKSLTDTDQLVLTSRTDEYTTAITEARDVLTSAAVIAPEPLTAAQAAEYLTHCLPPDPDPSWCAGVRAGGLASGRADGRAGGQAGDQKRRLAELRTGYILACGLRKAAVAAHGLPRRRPPAGPAAHRRTRLPVPARRVPGPPRPNRRHADSNGLASAARIWGRFVRSA